MKTLIPHLLAYAGIAVLGSLVIFMHLIQPKVGE